MGGRGEQSELQAEPITIDMLGINLEDAEARDLGPSTLSKYKLLRRRWNGCSPVRSAVYSGVRFGYVQKVPHLLAVAKPGRAKTLERLKSFFRFAVDAGWIPKADAPFKNRRSKARPQCR